MAKIRKYYCKKKRSKYEWDNFKTYRFSPSLFIHNLFPLCCKFKKEEFLATEQKNVLGFLSTKLEKGVNTRVRIEELTFAENCYDAAKQLIEFILSYYGAKGATSFFVKVSDVYSGLLNLFVSQYNFRQCSYEKLWRISRRKYEEIEHNLNIRSFRNSDAASVALMYNESLISHFRPSLSLTAKSFKESWFRGIQASTEFRYIIEDEKSSNILAFLSISTKDNENYVLDIIQTSWYQTPLDNIIAFTCSEIKKRNLNFNLFVKSKKYTVTGMDYEEFFANNKFLQAQTSILLVKDYYNTVSQNVDSGKFVMLGQPSY